MAEKQMVKNESKPTELAAYKGQPIDDAKLAAWMGDQQSGQFLTSLDARTPEGRKILLASLDGNTPQLADVVNKEIAMLGVTHHPVSITDDITGETVNAVRTVIHCEGGASYGCVSNGIVKSITTIRSLFGNPPWKEPIRVTPKRVATKGGRSRYTLEMSE